jgi:hypothetical protein
MMISSERRFASTPQRRARIMSAEAERQAAAKLIEMATIIAGSPEAMQLRSTLHDIAGDENSTIVFPLPIDLLRGFSSPRPA